MRDKGEMKEGHMRKRKQVGIRLSLAFYDFIIFCIVDLLLFVFYQGAGNLNTEGVLWQSVLAVACIFGCRFLGKIYRQIWRYGGIQCYIRLLITDAAACIFYLIAEKLLPVQHIAFAKLLAFVCMNTLGALAIRMVYRFAYKCGSQDDKLGAFLRMLLRIFAGGRVKTEPDPDSQKIKIAIIGAGTVGVTLAEELWNNPRAEYIPRCFIDANTEKAGRDIHGITVMAESEATLEELRRHHIQEVVLAIPNMPAEKKKALYEYYTNAGFQLKVYDFPFLQAPGRKRQLREFDIEELLFRKPVDMLDEKSFDYYKDKVVLITGGGGSIGSELCRQIVKMHPKQIIVLDIYENCAYDVQQGLKFAYKNQVDIRVEIVSITNKKGLARVFEEYHPQIVVHAAAHKHVPLMEKNCIEAVENNVFGTLNVVQCCEEYGAERFMMVSTDKAVNPTNVMGATKRMCEMIALSYSTFGKVKYSATRFGNVLGSAGSVIPLFKRQLSAGGPLTVTDRRIIRYFMTIPEASQLVLQSGAMANNGELFVLDMGKPVKIWDLAENMIRLSGMSDIEIVETGLRPGEKLYEELLIKTEDLVKTDNDLIFIERDEPISKEELEQKLAVLKEACQTGDDEAVREAMRKVVPTYRRPEEVNEAVS